MLLTTMIENQLLYAAPIRSPLLVFNRNVKTLQGPQRRMKLRVTCLYRTVSNYAALVVARLPPVHLLAAERSLIYRNKRAIPGVATLRVHYAIGSQNGTKLQNDLGSKANSKHLTAWVTRKFGKTNFHLTQLLTGYGCFAYYLYKFKLLNSPTCINFEAPVEDVKHTFVQCDQWWNKRRLLEDQLE